MTRQGYDPSDGETAPSKQRRRAATAGIVLTLVLIALIIILVLLVPRLQKPAYEPVAGIRPLLVLYGPGVGDKPFFDDPMGVAFGKGGRVYVADTGNDRIVVFDAEGRFLFEFGGRGIGKPAPGAASTWKQGLFNYPTDLDVDGEGNVYVADFRNDQVQVFDADGDFLRVFPDRLKRVGKGASGQDGTGVAVTSVEVHGDRVYVTDRYQILVFTLQGKLVSQFGKPGMGASDLDHPTGITLDIDSSLIVADSNHNRVLAFAPNGDLLWSYGGPVGLDWSAADGPLEVPRSLTTTLKGEVLVADAMASQLVLLSAKGAPVTVLGERGTGPGQLNFPTDVCRLGSRYAVAEKGNDRIQVFQVNEE